MNDRFNASQALSALDRQHNRLLRLSFPKDDGPANVQMLANRIDAHEAISKDFHFKVEILSDSPDVELKEMMGKMITITMVRECGTPRFFNGYVYDFRFIKSDSGFAFYDCVLMPWTCQLRLVRDNYIFHGKTVCEQIELIFNGCDERDWKTKALGTDEPMTDAVQWDETDYNYVMRRIEERGWHYWYEHRADGHTLVISGDSTAALPIDGPSDTIVMQDDTGTTGRGLWSFSPVRTMVSSQYSATSFDFKSPRPVHVDVPTLNQQGDVPQMEIYEYAGAYGFKNIADGDAFVRRRMEEIEASAKHVIACGDDDRVQPRRSFQLKGPGGAEIEGDNAYMIIEANHVAANNYEAGDAGASHYSNRLTCLRKKIPWRPGRGYNSIQPHIYGIQTATVVGPKGEEIHTDEYGRVRVQFHWDREGTYDEKSSAWVRVATLWAGSNFGGIAIPRIGDEVLVQFLDGNPDRPLITGSVYNQGRMPPWTLPDNKTQTGILTRSTKGAGYDNANAIRFEDKKGAEELWLHAEKDQRIEVEHDESHWVGNDRTKTIDHDETVHVKHDRTETVDNNETITVHNNRTERVDNNETISIGNNRTEDVGANETVTIGSNRSVTVGGAKSEKVAHTKTETIGLAKMLTIGGIYQTTVGGAMNTTVALAQAEQVGLSKNVIVGKTFDISAGDELNITVGKSKLTMKSDGSIIINGHTFSLGTTDEQTFKADANITMKAKKILEN